MNLARSITSFNGSARAWAVFIVALLVLVLGASATVGVLRTRDSQSQLSSLEAQSRSASAIERARGDFLDATGSLAALILNGNPSRIFGYDSSIQLAQDDLIEAREIIMAQGRLDDAKAIDKAISDIEAFDETASSSAKAFITGDLRALGAAQQQLTPLAEEIVEGLKQAALLERGAVTEERSRLDSALSTTLVITLALGILGLASGGLAMAALVWVLVRPLTSLRKGARAIAAGDLERRIEVSGPEEVRSLASDLNQMTETLVARNRDLEHARGELQSLNESLESRVVERTEKLSQVNAELRTEMAERKSAQEELRQTADTLEALIAASPVAIMACDLDLNVSIWNDTAEEMFGWKREEIVGQPYPIVPVAGKDEFEELRERVSSGRAFTAVETQRQTKSGELIDVAVSTAPLRSADGTVEGIVAVLVDITERKRAEKTIRHLAYHDGLSGLPNRTLFVDRLKQAVAAARRSGELVAVMFLDLDHFKDVNDTVGHAGGDRLLRKVARRLQSLLREGDTLARFGGDEFVLLLPNISDAEAAGQAAQRILGALNKTWKVANREFHLSASIGVTIAPIDGGDPDTLLRNADTAMYRAKEHGRNSFELYTPEMNEQITRRLALESDLRRAIEGSEFVLHYQPQVEISTGRIVGVEALVRWMHPERGLLLPGEFIPMAEASGLILPLGEWVLEQACTDGMAWERAGVPPIRIAVNLSARQFEHRALTETVMAVLEETGLPPERLQLELTEGVAMTDISFTVETLHSLRNLGVQIAIDDFGTGHSSLAYLKQLPIDAVKIDGSFINGLTEDPVDAMLVNAIVAISHSIDLTVIAECVETEEQLEFLRRPKEHPGPAQDHPCDEFQGFLFSKAVPADQIAKMLTTGGKKTRRVPASRTS
ncbi:MAG: EAL domain-containing protein [Chloroflexi bacterium]|nr:EAL domain-containing protein [Chloroflexota bacterium]